MGCYDSLDWLQDEIYKCIKCGNCQAVCPIYKEKHQEASTARGKVQLAKALLRGELVPSRELAQRFALCLTCKACQANCPGGIKSDKIILAARGELVRRQGLPWFKSMLFQGVKRPKLFDWGLKVGRRMQGMIPASPFPSGLDVKRVVPPLAAVPLRQMLPEVNSVSGSRRKVVFFTGCMINYVYTGIGVAAVNVLQANGLEVLLPPDQHCCGLPLLTHGDVSTAKAMARSQVDLLSRIEGEAIIVACATCGSSLKHHYPDLLANDSAYRSKAEDIAAKTFDVTEYLAEQIEMRLPAGAIKSCVTYHDPCHLARGQNVRQQPRQIIQSIPGIKFVEMANPDSCCGGAGSFALTHGELSRRIGQKKAGSIGAAGAEKLVTGCPSCLMQLTDNLQRLGIKHMEVLHTVELLDRAYRFSP